MLNKIKLAFFALLTFEVSGLFGALLLDLDRFLGRARDDGGEGVFEAAPRLRAGGGKFRALPKERKKRSPRDQKIHRGLA
jgi:hypothetical protein